jgi:hypothetical protein
MSDYFCECTDADEPMIPAALYCAVHPIEWVCYPCLAQWNRAIVPSLVDSLGINIRDLFAPEYQEESE